MSALSVSILSSALFTRFKTCLTLIFFACLGSGTEGQVKSKEMLIKRVDGAYNRIELTDRTGDVDYADTIKQESDSMM